MINDLADGSGMGLATPFWGVIWLAHCRQVVVGQRKRRGGLSSCCARERKHRRSHASLNDQLELFMRGSKR